MVLSRDQIKEHERILNNIDIKAKLGWNIGVKKMNKALDSENNEIMLN